MTLIRSLVQALSKQATLCNVKKPSKITSRRKEQGLTARSLYLFFFFISPLWKERGDDTWRGIPDRLVNETYVSRHSSMYMFF